MATPEENLTPLTGGQTLANQSVGTTTTPMSVEAPKYPTGNESPFQNPINQTPANMTVSPPAETKAPVLTLSSENAQAQVAKDTQKLADLEAANKPPVPTQGADDNQFFVQPDAGTKVEEKSAEKPAPGYTLEEALSLFGKDFTGLTQQADGTFKADADALKRIGITGVKTATTTAPKSEEIAISKFDQQMEDLAGQIMNYNVNADPEFAIQTNAIKAQYDKLRADMAKVNKSREAQLSQMGIRKGTARYAGEVQLGILGEEIKQGGERILEINRQQDNAIANARKALKDEKFSQLNAELGIIDKLRSNKVEALDRQEKKIAEAAKVAEDANKQDLEILKYQASLMSDDIKEYEYAKSQGFTGDMFDYRAKIKAAEAGAEKPMIVSAGSSIYDPISGQFLGTAPKPIDTSAPEIKTWGGQVHQWNPNSQSWESLGNENAVGDTSNYKFFKVGDTDYVDTGDGNIKLASDLLPTSQTQINPEKLKQYNDIVSLTDIIIGHRGENGAVGAGSLRRGELPIPLPFGLGFKIPFSAGRITGSTKEFIGKVQQMADTLTLAKLIEVKGQGATFGALSDSERAVIERAATPINQWKITDENGNVVGYNISQKAFDEEIKKIQNDYQNRVTVNKQIGTKDAVSTFNNWYANEAPDEDMGVINEMLNDQNLGSTAEERKKVILERYGIGFNKGTGGTPIARAIQTPDDTKGGQCGRFVNKLTGLGVGDSYQSKMAKMDSSIKKPEPGMVFVMPYRDTGHIGFIIGINGDKAIVKDSNWYTKSAPETVKTHEIPLNQITGLKRVA